MIITCPECATRYSVKPDAIGPNGRTVRCAACEGTWFVPAEPDVLELEPDITEPSSDVAAAAMAGSETPPHQKIRQKAEKKKVQGRRISITAIWLFMLLVFMILVLLAFLFRHQIVERFPQTATTYKMLGMETTASGLVFENVQAEMAYIEGIPAVVVRGAVRNYDDRTREAPLVQMRLLDKAGSELASWIVELSSVFVPAHGHETFTTQFPSPPVEATELAYTFVTDADLLVIQPPADAGGDQAALEPVNLRTDD